MAIATTFRRDPPPGVVVERETGSGAHDFAARGVSRTGSPSSTARSSSAPRSRRATRDGRDDRLRLPLGATAPAGSARWRPTRRCNTAASARRCSPRCAPTSTPRGHATGEISWVSNLRFYGKCGATRVPRLPGRPPSPLKPSPRKQELGDRQRPVPRRPSAAGTASSAPKSPAIFTWPRMNPTERSSVPVVQRLSASAGVAVNVTSAGRRRGAPSPRSTTRASSTRAQPRACSFLPCGDDELDEHASAPARVVRASRGRPRTGRLRTRPRATRRCRRATGRAMNSSHGNTSRIDVVGEAHPEALRDRPACGARAAPRAACAGSRRRR